jgi:hypothetical protein
MTRAEQRLADMLDLYDVELPTPPEDHDTSRRSWTRYERELERLPRPIVRALRDLMAIELEAEGVVILPNPGDDPDDDGDDPGPGQPKTGPPNRKPAGRRRAFRCKETRTARNAENMRTPWALQYLFSHVCAAAAGKPSGSRP